VHAIHGDDLPSDILIFACGAALGGQRVLDAARILADQSGIPRRNLTLQDLSATYTHNDPNSAHPRNRFVDELVRFLGKLSGRTQQRLPILAAHP
jgi:hypothetical protein